ncbi:hypothetical protein [Evansella clarkii]|uniref:hypothetical protein n=1 Tax=Evansella clarkii TaxID=79879 RepID=UPI000B449B86|nr:hypothetical protein [Evansella clarkii]
MPFEYVIFPEFDEEETPEEPADYRELKRKRITVEMTDAEYDALKAIAEDHNVRVSQVLGAFVADLTDEGRRNGSDEVGYAWAYLNRTWIGIMRDY